VITALLLDVDDTLIDTRAAMVAAGQAAVTQLWPQVGVEAQHAAGVHFHGDPSGFFGRFTRGEISFEQMRAARVADLLESFSLSAVEEVNSRFEEVYSAAFAANVRLFEDVLPLLEAADATRIRIGLLTNSSSQYTQQKLEITGLSGLFASVATRDSLGFGKPDPRAFHHACRLLRSDPAETIYVGDDIEIDAIAACSAGLCAVWLRREPADPADAVRAGAREIPVVTSLSQVPALWTRH
jgi:putative hydrolase of the HAD superfamily